MGFINNLFGTIARDIGLYNSSVGFIPKNSDGDVIDLNRSAAWLGLEDPNMQLYAYKFCSPLASVVDKLASYDINGHPEILRAGGKGKEDYATSDYALRLNTLFSQPNPLQSWAQFRAQQKVYMKIFGFCPVMPLVPAGFSDNSYAYQIWNLPPWLFDVEATGKMIGQRNIKGIVTHWVLNINGERAEIPAERLFILEDGIMPSQRRPQILPMSKLVGLDMSVSNYCAAMEADNVLLKKKGPLGFMSHDAAATKDSVAGYLPMTHKEKQEVQNDLNQYGLTLNQWQYVISRQAMKWNPISFDVKQLGTSETVIKAEKEICHRFDFPYIIFEQTEGAYSAQGQKAMVMVYQDNVIPSNRRDFAKYEKFFKMSENNCKFVADFSHLYVLQPDRLLEAQTLQAQTNALLNQYKNNIITLNMMLTELGKETRPDGDIYYNQTEEYARQQQQATITA